MSRSLSKRDRWALVVLPAIFVIGIYVYGVIWPNTRALRDVRARLAAARGQTVTQVEVDRQEDVVVDLKRRVETERRRRDRLKAPAPASSTQPIAPPGTIERVIRMLEEPHVDLLEKEEVVPRAQAAQRYQVGASMWRLKLRGSYVNVRGWLGRIESDTPAVPVGLTTEPLPPDGGPAERVWTVWLFL